MTGRVATSSAAPPRAGERVSAEVFRTIRRRMVLECCKWDPQVGDVGTLAPFPLLLPAGEWEELRGAAEALAAETVALEERLVDRPALWAELGMPRTLRRAMEHVQQRSDPNLRVMRFDFHPTAEGWWVSEVNSDVPGGYSEASALAAMMVEHFPGARVPGNPAAKVADAIEEVTEGTGRPVALLTAPGFMEDQQVVSHLGRVLKRRGVWAGLVSPGQVVVRGGEAGVASSWHTGPVGVMVRFFQAEWLPRLGRGVNWRGLVGTRTPMLNPVRAVLTESKRLPVVWDELGAETPTWRRYLPETRDPRRAPWQDDEGWLLKTAYCNTGDTVTIRPRLTARQWARIRWDVGLNPRGWVAQRRFDTRPVESPLGLMYPCVGVYTVGGHACGAYGRLSRHQIVDFAAIDVAVLVEPEAEEVVA